MRTALTMRYTICFVIRKFCSAPKHLFEASDENTLRQISTAFKVTENFVTEAEEAKLLEEIEPHLKRLRYEHNHWDGAIVGYREIERKNWSTESQIIMSRVRSDSFTPDVNHLPMVHCLDLAKDGQILPHIDAIRFCGNTLAGLCLMSPAIMRLTSENDPAKWVKILLPQRSLYVMSGTARYNFTHAILGDKESFLYKTHVPRHRRISIMFRIEPNET